VTNDITLPYVGIVQNKVTLSGFEACLVSRSRGGNKRRYVTKLQDFIWYDVPGDGNCLSRAVAMALWGPYEDRQYMKIKADVQAMWNTAKTEGTEMFRFRNDKYLELARFAAISRTNIIGIRNEQDVDLSQWQFLEDQVSTDGAWCSEHYIQLIADCYDLAIFVWQVREDGVELHNEPTKYRGRLPDAPVEAADAEDEDEDNPPVRRRRQIHIVNSPAWGHFQTLIAYPPVATHFENVQGQQPWEDPEGWEEAVRSAAYCDWVGADSDWRYWPHLEESTEPTFVIEPKWPGRPVGEDSEDTDEDTDME